MRRPPRGVQLPNASFEIFQLGVLVIGLDLPCQPMFTEGSGRPGNLDEDLTSFSLLVQNYVVNEETQHLLRSAAEHKMDAEIAKFLNREGYISARGTPFRGDLVHLLRRRWAIPTVKINGAQPNPPRWRTGAIRFRGWLSRWA